MYPQKIDDSHFYWEYTMSYALKTIQTLNSPCGVNSITSFVNVIAHNSSFE